MLHRSSNSQTTENIVLIRCRWCIRESITSGCRATMVRTRDRKTSLIASMPLLIHGGTPWWAKNVPLHATGVLLASHGERHIRYCMWLPVMREKQSDNKTATQITYVLINGVTRVCCHRPPHILVKDENQQLIYRGKDGQVSQLTKGTPKAIQQQAQLQSLSITTWCQASGYRLKSWLIKACNCRPNYFKRFAQNCGWNR